jgi:hypothetical protein
METWIFIGHMGTGTHGQMDSRIQGHMLNLTNEYMETWTHWTHGYMYIWIRYPDKTSGDQTSKDKTSEGTKRPEGSGRQNVRRDISPGDKTSGET